MSVRKWQRCLTALSTLSIKAQKPQHHPKKKTTTYREQDPQKIKRYEQKLAAFDGTQRVYLDETGVEVYLHRPYGRSGKGKRVQGKINGKRYRRVSLVAAQVDGRLIAPMIYTETMTGAFFEAWFSQELLPALGRKSVIIMDNARFHRMKHLEGVAHERGHKLVPLPPCSPELNPIRNIKRYLHKVLKNVSDFDAALLSYFQVE